MSGNKNKSILCMPTEKKYAAGVRTLFFGIYIFVHNTYNSGIKGGGGVCPLRPPLESAPDGDSNNNI